MDKCRRNAEYKVMTTHTMMRYGKQACTLIFSWFNNTPDPPAVDVLRP